MPKIFNAKKVSSSRILTIPMAIALASIFTSCNLLPVSEELTAQEDFFLDDPMSQTWNSPLEVDERTSIHARKFRCVGVKRVRLKGLYFKAGEVTTTTDVYSSNSSKDNAESSSCLFTLFFGSGFVRPWVDFAFAGSPNSVSGNAKRLPTKDSLGFDIQADGSLYQNYHLRTISAQTSIEKGESELVYIKIINSTPPYKIPDSKRLVSIPEIKHFSNIYQDVEIFAVELTWLN
ncbi:MAG: hypothetical protein AAFO95_13565 [Cyanobacteria bacterium J06600_6]